MFFGTKTKQVTTSEQVLDHELSDDTTEPLANKFLAETTGRSTFLANQKGIVRVDGWFFV